MIDAITVASYMVMLLVAVVTFLLTAAAAALMFLLYVRRERKRRSEPLRSLLRPIHEDPRYKRRNAKEFL